MVTAHRPSSPRERSCLPARPADTLRLLGRRSTPASFSTNRCQVRPPARRERVPSIVEVGMSSALIVWLVFGFVALVLLHELTHVLIARFHGHPTVCVAINPIGVAVVFEDSPRARYWLLQVILPAIVSWAVCYVWLYGLFTYPAPFQARINQAD